MIIGMFRQFQASHTKLGTRDLGLIYIIVRKNSVLW